MDTYDLQDELAAYDWRAKLKLPQKATAEQQRKALLDAEGAVAEREREPLLYETTAEWRHLFMLTAEEILRRHLQNGGGFIPRHVLTLMVYAVWEGIEIPADDEAAWQLARRRVREEWKRIASFLQQKDVVERINTLDDLR